MNVLSVCEFAIPVWLPAGSESGLSDAVWSGVAYGRVRFGVYRVILADYRFCKGLYGNLMR
jgi:hypothetical protein